MTPPPFRSWPNVNILSLDGRMVAQGTLYAGEPEWMFQATHIILEEGVNAAKEVLAEIGTEEIHLLDWRRRPEGRGLRFACRPASPQGPATSPAIRP